MYKKNTTGQYVYFVLVNASTGAALTGASVTGKRGVDGAAQASVTGTITEDAGGQYHLAMSAADCNGNNIGFLFTATSAVPVGIDIITDGAPPTVTLSAAAIQAIWDALTSALTTAGSIGKLLVDKIDATISSRSSLTTTNILDATLSGHTSAGTVGGALNTAGSASDPWSTSLPGSYSSGQAGYIVGHDPAGVTTLLSRIGAALSITGGKVDVNDKTGFSLSSAGVQAIWDALTSALTTVGSIGKLIVDNLNAAVGSLSTNISAIKTKTDQLVFTTSNRVDASALNSVTVGTNNDKTGYTLSSAGIQGVWDRLTSALTTSGSIGKLLVDNINATISSRLATSALTITGGKVDINDKTGFELNSTGIAGIWNALLSGMVTTGSVGKRIADDLNAAITTRATPADLSSITVTTNDDKTGYTLSSAGIQAVWDALMTALTTSGSVGKLLKDNLNATVSSRLATAAIALDISGKVTVGENDDKTGYSLDADGLDSANTELSTIPGETASLRHMIQYVYEYLRNQKTVTGDTETLFKGDSSTPLGTAAITDDGTTFTKGIMG